MDKDKMLVYYGSYTLKYWLELIINKDICLPAYQRPFVWDPNMVIELYETLKKGYYVPPVLIANYNCDNNSENLILDGQQRLSSILLCFFGVYPDSSYNEDADEESFSITWDINKIIDLIRKKYKGKEIFSLRQEIRNDILSTKKYVSFDNNERFIKNCQNKELPKEIVKFNDKELFENTLLGYSYTKYINPNPKKEKIAYANIFRTINTSGKSLRAIESRRSLYWIGDNQYIDEHFFEPNFVKNIYVNDKQFDFVEVLSYVAEYNIHNNYKVAVGYKVVEKREKYFEDFINSVLFSDINDKNKDINSTFGNIYRIMTFEDNLNKNQIKEVIKERLEELENIYKYIKDNTKNTTGKYKNRVEPQVYLFGAIHYTLYKGEKINKCDELIKDLNKEIDEITKNGDNRKEYNTLNSIRARLQKSIEVYGKYVLRI